nr:gephyrin-like molybdotransferase Glp [Chthonobacter albigriseus]
MLPVEEAQARLLAGVRPVEAEHVGIADAGGRVLASDLSARRTQPPFAASAMDGYAVRAADLQPGARLRVIGDSIAGRGFGHPVAAGEAVRIFTGAPVPDGADTILIQENARRNGEFVVAEQAEPAGRFIRRAGLDFSEGDVLLRAGLRLDGRLVALAAAMNHADVAVRRRPRVALLATGDELVQPGAPIGPDQIVASNALGLAADIRALGGEVIDLGIAPDDLGTIRARIRQGIAAKADVICLLGGASVGDYDLTRPALEAEGMVLDFWKIAMRPGKPLIVGRHGDTVMLGLPGNPVSTMVCGLLFLKPLVRALLGEAGVLPIAERATLGAAMGENDQRQDYVRARLRVGEDGRLIATPLDLQDSSMLSRLALAEALIVRVPGAPPAQAGSVCEILRLP